jgi:hypothetical protein
LAYQKRGIVYIFCRIHVQGVSPRDFNGYGYIPETIMPGKKGTGAT